MSQGEQSVREGGRYAMASVGAEIKDPQTGESLGRIETPCCEVVVDRVTRKVSHGHLENVHVPLDGVRTGGLPWRLRVKASGRAVETQRDNGIDFRSGDTGNGYVEASVAREGDSRKG